jgi:hypothetical protein
MRNPGRVRKSPQPRPVDRNGVGHLRLFAHGRFGIRNAVMPDIVNARPTLLSLLLVAMVLTPVAVGGRMTSNRPCLTASAVTCHQAPRVLGCSCCKASEPGDQPGIAQGRVEVNVDQQMLAAAVPRRDDAGRYALHLARFDASPPHRTSVALFVLLADLRL